MKFLLSKTTIPKAMDHLVARPRLCDIFRKHKDTSSFFVIAPAGYGKTSLTMQFFEGLPAKMKSWISLESHDSDPRIFCGYMLEALSRPIPGIRKSGLYDLLAVHAFDCTQFTNDLCFFLEEYKGPTIWLALDNYETVNHEFKVSEMVSRILNYSLLGLKIIINSREKPLIQMQKLQESGKAQILSINDLKFTREELSEAIRIRTDRRLNENEIEKVYKITRGWCVSLGFIDELMRHTNVNTGMEFINNINGTSSISEYLNEEISSNILPGLQNFLAHCSPLDIISHESCRVFMNDHSEIEDNLRLLKNSSVPFVIVEKDEFRLHPLIRQAYNEYLKDQMPLDELQEHYRRISSYYLQLDDPVRAIDLLFEIKSYNQALELLNDQWQRLLATNKVSAVSKWLSCVPEKYRDNPIYISLETNYNVFLGSFKEAMERMKHRLAATKLPNGHPVLGTLWYYYNHCLSCVEPGPHYQNMLDDWDKFNNEYGPFDESVLIGTNDMLGYTAYYELKMKKAIKHIDTALKLTPPERFAQYQKYQVLRELLRHEDGDTPAAQANLKNMIASFEGKDASLMPPLPLIFYSRMLAATGQFESAIKYINLCKETIQYNPLFNDIITVHLNRYEGMCNIYMGHMERGLEFLRKSMEWAQRSFLSEYSLSALIYAFYCDANNADPQAPAPENYPGLDFESEALLYHYLAKLHRAIKAANYDVALEILRKLENIAVSNSLFHWQVTCKFHQAYIQYELGNIDISNTLLESGAKLLAQINWNIYPSASPLITSFVIIRLVILNENMVLIENLVPTIARRDLLFLIKDLLENDQLANEQKQRIMNFAIDLNAKGLFDIARKWSHSPDRALSDLATRYIQKSKNGQPPALQVRTFGGFNIEIDGKPIIFKRQKARELLVWLLLQHPKPIHEEVIMEYLWPNSNPAKSKSNLQTIVSSLRKSLDIYSELDSQSYIKNDSCCYSIYRPDLSEIDFVAFQTGAAGLQNANSKNLPIKAEEAINLLQLHTGDFLPEYQYEEFTASKREELRICYFDILEDLAAQLIRDSRHAEAHEFIKAGLKDNPLWEEGVKLSMQSYVLQDKTLYAIKEFRKYERCLREQLNLSPSSELQNLFSEIQSL